MEDHTTETPAQVVNTICVIDTAKQSVTTLVSGADFYASPCFSPDGKHFAYQQWFHPDMPWYGAEIHVADCEVVDGLIRLTNGRHVAGKKRDISASYPLWASNDTLLFTSDESGFQNSTLR